MNTINPNVLLGTCAVIAVMGLGLITSQLVFAQETTSATDELKGLITAVGGIVSTLGAIAAAFIGMYAKIGQKFGLLKEEESRKLLYLAEELKNTDQWSKDITKDLVALADTIHVIPGAEKLLEQKRIDLKVWREEAVKLDKDLEEKKPSNGD